MENIRLSLIYEVAVFSSSSICFSPSPNLPSKNGAEGQKETSKTPRGLILFHVFPNVLGISFPLLTFPSLVVESFLPPHFPTKPWQPHLVALLLGIAWQ